MKKSKWLQLLLVIACVAAFFGYRALDRLRTDTQPPQITVAEEALSLSVQDPQSALLAGVTATDDRDGDVTASLVVERVKLAEDDGTVKVTYAAFDSAGNVAKATRQVRYTDYQSPRFSLDAPLVFAYDSNFDIMAIIGATDTLDGDISHRVRATSLDGSSVAAPGNHQVQFQVTNTLGDTVELTLPVEVYTAGTYNASLTLTKYLIYLDAGTAFSPEKYLNSFTANQETVDLRNGVPTGYTLKVTGSVNTAVPGVYTVSYKLSYTDMMLNGQVYTGYTKLTVVVEG